MPVHDEYARVTPLELSFPDADAADERFGAIAGEAEARNVDPEDPSAFVLLMEAGRVLRELRGPGDEPERVREHGVLLYHLFHAWRAGSPLYLLDRRVVRLVVESGPWQTGALRLPEEAAGYVQLPRHMVWVRAVEGGGAPGEQEASASADGAVDGTPESVDGLFWTRWGARISFLLVMGIRPDRPGFGVVPLDPVPADRLEEWIDTPMRGEGDDFVSSMPGAELDRLYEMRTAGEAVKLAARILQYLATSPEASRVSEAPREVAAGDGPRPSARAWIRVTLTP